MFLPDIDVYRCSVAHLHISLSIDEPHHEPGATTRRCVMWWDFWVVPKEAKVSNILLSG